MSDVGERMLAELKRIRELLAGEQPLGFGNRPETGIHLRTPRSRKVEWHGNRAKPSFDRTAVVDDLLAKVQMRFGLSSPFEESKG